MSYSPIQSLHIKNFQSLEDAHIPMGGLTVLVGQGDVGKSAVLRALRAICLNDGHDDDIRHGTNRCEVELTFEDGMSITWWKDRGKGGCYRMGETEYTKTGGVVPDAIAEYLGIGVLEIDATTELTPQFSDQHDAPYFFSETGSKRARILGKATHLDTVVTAQMKCKNELDKSKRDGIVAEKEFSDTELRLDALPDYAAIELDIQTATRDLETVTESIARADRINEIADRLETLRTGASAVEVAPLLMDVIMATKHLDRAERLQFLADRIGELRNLTKANGDLVAVQMGALADLQLAAAAACKEQGICIDCGGLLSHKECAV